MSKPTPQPESKSSSRGSQVASLAAVIALTAVAIGLAVIIDLEEDSVPAMGIAAASFAAAVLAGFALAQNRANAAAHREELAAIRGEMGRLSAQLEDCEAELKISRLEAEKLRVFFDLNPDAMYLVTFTGRATPTIIDANESAAVALGYARSELIGRNPSLFSNFDGDFPSRFSRLSNQLTGKMMPYSARTRHRRKDGSMIDVESRVWARRIGDVDHLCIISRDISQAVQGEEERMIMTAQVLQTSKLASLGTMAAQVAHELNNALAPIKGFAQVILLEGATQKPVLDATERILKGATRMQSIIDQVLRFGRASSDDSVTEVDLNAAIEDALALVARQLSASGITCELDLDHELPRMLADRTKLESIFQNLLVNSRDAYASANITEPKRIRIRSRLGGDRLIVQYEDNAGGMPQEVLDRVFDPFFTTKPRGEGTGLGMSIVQGIVKEHHGNITVSSQPGHGTTFEISFAWQSGASSAPSLSSSIGHGHEATAVAAADGARSKPHVLIVDDEEDIAELLACYLVNEFRTTVFTRPQEALDAIARETFDLIISDVKMPGVSGIDILAAAKRHQPSTPVVIISGHAKKDDDVANVLAHGAVDILTKPFDRPEKIRQFLSALLGRSAA